MLANSCIIFQGFLKVNYRLADLHVESSDWLSSWLLIIVLVKRLARKAALWAKFLPLQLLKWLLSWRVRVLRTRKQRAPKDQSSGPLQSPLAPSDWSWWAANVMHSSWIMIILSILKQGAEIVTLRGSNMNNNNKFKHLRVHSSSWRQIRRHHFKLLRHQRSEWTRKQVDSVAP